MDTYPTSMTMPEFVLKILMFSLSVQLDGLLHLEICEGTTLAWIARQGLKYGGRNGKLHANIWEAVQ